MLETPSVSKELRTEHVINFKRLWWVEIRIIVTNKNFVFLPSPISAIITTPAIDGKGYVVRKHHPPVGEEEKEYRVNRIICNNTTTTVEAVKLKLSSNTHTHIRIVNRGVGNAEKDIDIFYFVKVGPTRKQK